MMFCIECGKPLPEGAKFCACCGTKQKQLENPQPRQNEIEEIIPDFPSNMPLIDFSTNHMPHGNLPPKPAPAYGAFGCSQRTEKSMVYVPGNGFYLLHHFPGEEGPRMYFISEDGTQIKQFPEINVDYAHSIFGLNYYNGEIYFFRYLCRWEPVMKLMAMDVFAHRIREVPLSEDVSLTLWDEAHKRACFVVKDGVGYGLCRNLKSYGTLVAVNLSTGLVQYRALPDLRDKACPPDWQGYLSRRDSSMENYGAQYNGLYLTGQYGYAGVDAPYHGLSIRFPLENPESFAFVPMGSFYPSGVLTGMYNGFMLWAGGDAVYATRVTEEGFGQRKKLVDIPNGNGQYWFKLGKQYIIAFLMMDFGANKTYKLPFRIFASDFAEAGDGGAYVYDGFRIYHLPPNYLDVIHSDEDLKRFVMFELKQE